MTATVDCEAETLSPAPTAPPDQGTAFVPVSVAAAFSAVLTACGGGGDSTPAPAPAPAPAPSPAPAAPTAAEASRFLAQASMGASRAQIVNGEQVQPSTVHRPITLPLPVVKSSDDARFRGP